MIPALKITHASEAGLDRCSTMDEVCAALVAAYLAGAKSPVAIEDQAGLPRGSLDRDFANLDALDEDSDDPAVRAASRYLNRHNLSGATLRFDGKHFDEFVAGRWRRLPKAALQRQLFLDLRETHAVLRDVVATLERFCFVDPAEWQDSEAAGTPFLNLRNGELHLQPDFTPELRPHRAWSNQVSVTDYDYDPEKTCPLFDETIEDILSANDEPKAVEAHLLELMSYAIQHRRDLPVITLLKGAGANGKSLILHVLEHMVGREQVMRGPVRRLTSDAFTLHNIQGKRIFIDDDAPDDLALDAGVLKSIVEEKRITTRGAHARETTSFVVRVTPFIATNGTPRFHDTSDGFARRLLVIPFQRRFTPEEIDPDLGRDITDLARPGILNRLLEAHARLRTRGRFAPPPECLKAARDALAQGNDFRAFLDEMTEMKPGAKVRTSDLYIAYRQWQAANGGNVGFRRNQMPAKLEGMGYLRGKSNGQQCFVDLALKAAPSREAAND